MTNSWTYPIKGDIHYFTRAGDQQYSPSGVLRSVALFIDQTLTKDKYATIEGMMFYPEDKGWSAMVAVYHDKPNDNAA